MPRSAAAAMRHSEHLTGRLDAFIRLLGHTKLSADLAAMLTERRRRRPEHQPRFTHIPVVARLFERAEHDMLVFHRQARLLIDARLVEQLFAVQAHSLRGYPGLAALVERVILRVAADARLQFIDVLRTEGVEQRLLLTLRFGQHCDPVTIVALVDAIEG